MHTERRARERLVCNKTHTHGSLEQHTTAGNFTKFIALEHQLGKPDQTPTRNARSRDKIAKTKSNATQPGCSATPNPARKFILFCVYDSGFNMRTKTNSEVNKPDKSAPSHLRHTQRHADATSQLTNATIACNELHMFHCLYEVQRKVQRQRKDNNAQPLAPYSTTCTHDFPHNTLLHKTRVSRQVTSEEQTAAAVWLLSTRTKCTRLRQA